MTINPDGRAINFLAASQPIQRKAGSAVRGKVLRNTVRGVWGNAVRERFKKPGLARTAENSECLRRNRLGTPGQCEKNISRKRTAAICGGVIVQKWGPCVAAVYII